MRYKTTFSLAAAALSSIALADEPPAPPTANQQLFDPFLLKNDCHLDVTADLLFWRASQDGLDFVIKNKGSTSSVTHGHVEDPDFSWDFGFRIGLDYKMPHDQWDLNGRYTYFHASASESESAPAGGALFPIWTFNGGTADHAKAKWFCNLNRGDLELGRNCMVSKWLSIRPFMGVTGAVINERFHVNYSGGTAVPAGDSDHIKMESDFWGVGIRFGFNSLWGLGKGFSIYADGAGSLLSGHFSIHQKEHLNRDNTTILGIRDSQSSVSPILEIALGFQWDHFWDAERYHFGVKLGWEFNQYFNQNRLMHLSNINGSPGFFNRNNDDLSFMGITLGFRFDF
jgi:hypothetical protein